ncbi:MAG: nickel-dependent lactate racemase [Lachnospiraceae bacterium]|nr:nickel-dependent lactate racemase [Lachnospiraceae bacterium]
MELCYGYGKETRSFSLADANLLCEATQNPIPVDVTGMEAVQEALARPIGTPRLRDMVHAGSRIVIVTSDITRPCPSNVILPALLEELSLGGVSDSQLTVVFALGSHRRHTEDERRRLVGKEIFSRIACVDSGHNGFVRLGETSFGTPVDIDKTVAEADFLICVGNIEYHYFAGYSGGAKAVMPGVSTWEAIQENHSRMVLDAARAGNLHDNPLRQDIEEAGRMLGIDFILNVVLDEEKNIIRAVAGDVKKAHEAGCEFLDRLYKVSLPKAADIVITTPGGFPKDLNLYQSQKALDNAKYAVREGGILILAAACTEGAGSGIFEEWMTAAASPDDLLSRIQTDFRLGGHKAAAIAMVLKKNRIFLVSDMEPELVRSFFMEPFASVEEALSEAFACLGRESSVIFIPHGGSVLPQIRRGSGSPPASAPKALS